MTPSAPPLLVCNDDTSPHVPLEGLAVVSCREPSSHVSPPPLCTASETVPPTHTRHQTRDQTCSALAVPHQLSPSANQTPGRGSCVANSQSQIANHDSDLYGKGAGDTTDTRGGFVGVAAPRQLLGGLGDEPLNATQRGEIGMYVERWDEQPDA